MISSLLGNGPKVHSELLKEHEGEDSLGPESHEGGDVSLVEGHGPGPPGVADQVQRAAELPGLSVHGPGLQHVQGLGHGGGDGSLEVIEFIIN